MKYSRSPSLERYVMGRDSVLTFSSFSPARKVFSSTAPLSIFLSRVLTNAPPLPGLTCWKCRIVKRLPSTLIAVPFLNWLVDIMIGSSPSRRLIFAAILHGVNPAQTPRYYRTVSLPVSPAPRKDCNDFACRQRPPIRDPQAAPRGRSAQRRHSRGRPYPRSRRQPPVRSPTPDATPLSCERWRDVPPPSVHPGLPERRAERKSSGSMHQRL